MARNPVSWHGFCSAEVVNRKGCDMENEDTAVQTIGVTVWGNRVSPVFDSARNLLVVELVGGNIVHVSTMEFDPDHPAQLVQLLQARNIDVVICGAVSEGPAAVLEAAGIELIPFIAGDVRKVVETFIGGNPEWTEFIMPGCGRKICCQGKIRRGAELGGRLMPVGQNGTACMVQDTEGKGKDDDNVGGPDCGKSSQMKAQDANVAANKKKDR